MKLISLVIYHKSLLIDRVTVKGGSHMPVTRWDLSVDMEKFIVRSLSTRKTLQRELHKENWHKLQWFLYVILIFLISGCVSVPTLTGTPNSLDPDGAAAKEIAELWWIMAALGTLVFVVVVGLLIYGAVRSSQLRREGDLTVERNPPRATRWIWIGGIIIPAIILAVVLFLSTSTHSVLAEPPETTVTIVEVIGHRWFWEVRYPNEDVITGNEIHIPVGEPVEVRLISADVIHSFWVPELIGKTDVIPGKVNSTVLQAEEPGIYRGLCAEFCGMQHARMQFIVVAQSTEEFTAWLEREQQPAREPADDIARLGQMIFLNSECAQCHTIRGTEATGDVGPDLTHIASRLTLGAGTLENTRGNLAGWVADPQSVKPGNLMPPVNLSGEELQALLAYLTSLE